MDHIFWQISHLLNFFVSCVQLVGYIQILTGPGPFFGRGELRERRWWWRGVKRIIKPLWKVFVTVYPQIVVRLPLGGEEGEKQISNGAIITHYMQLFGRGHPYFVLVERHPIKQTSKQVIRLHRIPNTNHSNRILRMHSGVVHG